MKKIHIIGPQGQKNINDLVIYLILPCNILHAFTQSAADGRLYELSGDSFYIHRYSGVLCDLRKSDVPGRSGGAL